MKLFINEFIKDYKKKSTLLYFILIFALIFVYELLNSYSYSIQDAIQPEAVNLIIDSLKISLVFSSMFMLIMFANNITQEYSKGTAKFLYTRPRSRSSILTSKIFLAIFNYLFLSITSFVYSMAIKKFIFYKDKINIHTVFNEKLSEQYFDRILWKQLLIYFGMYTVVTLFFISLVLIICTIFRTQILSVIVVIVMFILQDLFITLISFVVSKFEYVKYLFVNIPTLASYYGSEDSRQQIEELLKLNATSLLLMALCYTVAFTLISYIVNARRDITLD